jgi:VanZ family protein
MFLSKILPSICWAFFILVLCGLPPQNTGSFSLWNLFSVDKFLHFSVFSALALFLIVGLKRQYNYRLLRLYAIPIGIIVSSAYGVLIEYFQFNYFEGREGDWMDVVANTLGSIFGAIIFKIIYGNTIIRTS